MFLVIIHCIPPPYVGVRGGLLDDYPSSILNIHARLHRLRIKLHALEGEPGVVIIIGDDTQTCGYTIVLLKRARMLYIGANIPYLYITIFLKTDKRILKITKYLLFVVFFLLQFYNCGRKCRDGYNPTGWLLFRCCIRDGSSVVQWHALSVCD